MIRKNGKDNEAVQEYVLMTLFLLFFLAFSLLRHNQWKLKGLFSLRNVLITATIWIIAIVVVALTHESRN